MPHERQLNASGTVTSTDGFGSGTARVGPKYTSEIWEVTSAAVRAVNVGGVSPTIVARLYAGPPIPENLIALTYDGTNDSTDLKVTLQCGDTLTCQWATDPGGLAGFPTYTLSVYGTQKSG